MPRNADDSQVFQFKVTLLGIDPPIWRRIQVRGSTMLPKLHDTLQVVLGWHDGHLHSFTANGAEYAMPVPGGLPGTRSEQRVRLDRLVSQPEDRIYYLYDFGDNWEHELLVETVLPADPAMKYPLALSGALAGPPDDVGGIWGYDAFLEAIYDPNNPEHADMLEWAGGAFDPEAFDLTEVNRLLRLV